MSRRRHVCRTLVVAVAERDQADALR